MSGLTNHQAARVIADVAELHKLAPELITGRDWTRLACAARRAVWTRLVDMGASVTEAGYATGHHHTTVLHGLGRRG